jgi:pimeloyl-ACP methyl ester carboxylesterase
MSRTMWRPQVAALAGRFRCISVDLPGHGMLASVPFDLEGAVETVARAIDAAAAGRAVVVGLSLGGYVAMALAGRHPERVRGLVLAGCTREPTGLGRAAYELYAVALGVLPDAATRRTVDRWFRRRYGRRVTREITAGGYHLQAGGRAVREIAGTAFRARLLAYGGPVLVINGSHDLVFHLGSRRFMAGIPDVSWQILGGASHLSNVDRPEAFSAAIEAFAGGLS